MPGSVETFIRACTVSYGKAKLVLKHNKHYIESPFPEVLRELLKNPTVRLWARFERYVHLNVDLIQYSSKNCTVGT